MTPHLIRKTKRLIIRPMEISDFQSWKMYHTSMLPAQNKWDRTNKVDTEVTYARFKKIIQNQKNLRKEDKFYDLAIYEKVSGQQIGVVAAMDILRGLAHSAFLGYFIHNKFWGRGFGKEAVLAMIDISFRDIKLHRLEAGIEPSNRRSIFLARSLGFRKEGLKKRAVFLRNAWIDLVMYSATCEEFGFKWKSIPLTRLR